MGSFQETDNLFCLEDWQADISGWPTTAAGQLAIIPCFTEFRGKTYIYSENVSASRQCLDNGTWSTYANYSKCLEAIANSQSIPIDELESDQFASILNISSTILHYLGYSLSLASCLLAVFIYAKFRTLRRLRNVIHLNLILTYILSASAWFATSISSQVILSPEDSNGNSTIIRSLVIVFTYSQLTTFFWAFCEGIYMTFILFRPHKLEQLTFWPFGLGGWMVPAVIVTSWTIVKFTYENHIDWLRAITPCNVIFIVPILLVLSANLILMFIALYTIIQKHTRGQRTSSMLGRGVRSFLILMPLLGLTYVLGIVQPNDNGLKVPKAVFQIINSVMLPIQGFFVSVMYCFCNRQVRGLIKFHCFHKVIRRLGWYTNDRSPEQIVGSAIEKENSSMKCTHYDLRTFKGNTNELQYILRTRKCLARNNLSIHTESIRLSRMSSKSKFPVIVV